VIRSCENDYRKNTLQAYNELMIQRFGKRPPEPGLMQKLPMFLKCLFASKLMKTHWFIRNFVINKWFLQSHQAKLPAIKEASGVD